ncbi:arylamine N-acetyltransferase 1 [Rhexocercosporidium sp. MPI-PUGE-AT-0058]|nr:arylamine N-acetyltransferase 1 [Rhexocercosporidium sp. MPI-PUGE-AT-0058]
MPMHQNETALYTLTQVDAYLSRIAFPDALPTTTLGDKISPIIAQTADSLTYLTNLQKYHLASIPFENTSLHYAKFPSISLDKEDLFEKLVNRHRGGYCMEHNILFALILKTLGFEVVQSGARGYNSSGDSEFDGWNHQANFVIIDTAIYLVDVGFGSRGPTRPLALIDGAISKWGATQAEVRLTYHQNENPLVQETWIYSHRTSKSAEWEKQYSFVVTEFFQKDFEMIAYAISARRDDFLNYQLICVKMLLDEELHDIVGVVVLFEKTLKRRVQGETEVLKECESEEERVEILESYFGVVLKEKERMGIKSTVAAIK